MSKLITALIATGFATVAVSQTATVDPDMLAAYGSPASPASQSEHVDKAVKGVVPNEARVATLQEVKKVDEHRRPALDAHDAPGNYGAQTTGVTDTDLQPTVAIRNNNDQERVETLIDGPMLRIRVTPRTGWSYFLVPNLGGETFVRSESLGTGLKVPLWVLYSF